MTGQRLRRIRRVPRDAFTTEIFTDLCEVTPEIVIPMPDPYNDNITLKQNIANLFINCDGVLGQTDELKD